MSDTKTTNRAAMLAIARRHQDGEIDTNDAVDQLGAFTQLPFADRTRLLGELLDELAFHDLAATETTAEDPRVTQARQILADADRTSYDELVDTDPLELRDRSLGLHAALGQLLELVDERAVTIIRGRVAEEIRQPFAMTNTEMADLRDLPGDEYHEQCGEVYRRYFLRITRGERT